MEQEKSTFKQAFVHLYFLMLSADKVADIKELTLGNKIIKLENLDKTEVMKEMDFLSSVPREKVFDDGLAHLKLLKRSEQLKCLGYIKLIANIDGSVQTTEIDLLNNLSVNELNISLADISVVEKELKNSISKL
ncbi:MAG: hypothetical protein KAR17_18380 [Cyclobacteriaceae bacterium]|nr:hypothetical protein [Cyclobacteriaceae bacterium]